MVNEDQKVAASLLTDSALDTAISYEKLTNALNDETLAHKLTTKATTKLTKSTEDFKKELDGQQPVIDFTELAEVNKELIEAMQNQFKQVKEETEQAKKAAEKRDRLEHDANLLYPKREALLKRLNLSLDKQVKESESMLKRGAFKMLSAGISGFSKTISDLADSNPLTGGIKKGYKFVRDTRNDAFNARQQRQQTELISKGMSTPDPDEKQPDAPQAQPVSTQPVFERVKPESESGHKKPSSETDAGRLDAIEDRLTEIRDKIGENQGSLGGLFGTLFKIVSGLGTVIGGIVSGAIKTGINAIKDVISKLGKSLNPFKSDKPSKSTSKTQQPKAADTKQPKVDTDTDKDKSKSSKSKSPQPKAIDKTPPSANDAKMKKAAGESVKKGIKKYASKKGAVSVMSKLAPRLLGLTNPIGLAISGGLLAYDVYSYLDEQGYVSAAQKEISSFFDDDDAPDKKQEATATENKPIAVAKPVTPTPSAGIEPVHVELGNKTEAAAEAERKTQVEEQAQAIAVKGGSTINAPVNTIVNNQSNTTVTRRNYGFNRSYTDLQDRGTLIVR